MLRFATRRLLAGVPLVWGVATLIFLLAEIAPGRAFEDVAGPGVGREAAEGLRALFGTNRPVGERYLAWLAGALTGDLGVSLSFRAPVLALVAEGFRNTFVFAGLALLLQLLVGTGAGLFACLRKDGVADRAIVASASLLYSLPSFCLGVALVAIFSVRLGWLPASQMHSIDAGRLSTWGRLLDDLRHLILPALTLALPGAGGIALYVRERTRSVLASPFVTAARARGASRWRIVAVHGMRHALLPVVILVGLSLPGLAGGAAVVEVLYAWPGMGRLAFQAVLARDEPLILGCTLVASIAVVVGSLLADIAAAVVDPRVSGNA